MRCPKDKIREKEKKGKRNNVHVTEARVGAYDLAMKRGKWNENRDINQLRIGGELNCSCAWYMNWI